ncbi:hypothetical protein [Conchiformibius steedae]|uniref:hypothetical protein n=1 Tax=Conchiformibius steedae TaxID=153493 RepID=UPI0026EFD3AE|nr:hypothetical protein [Conchiformibius steedae]
MIIHSYRKYRKAQKHSRLARMGCGRSYLTLYQLLPADVVDTLSSRQIGVLVDLLYQQKEFGSNEMFKELLPHLTPLERAKRSLGG